jgi:hypothetical protein
VRVRVFALLLAGCQIGAGTGQVAGTVYLRSCANDTGLGTLAAPAAYTMNPTFFAAAPTLDFSRPFPMNRLSIRVQPDGRRIEEADVLLITIASVGQVAAVQGQAISVGPDTNTRASLVLTNSCPQAEVQMELDGSITFSAFGGAQAGAMPAADFSIDFGDHLAATFSFDIVDRRAIVLGGTAGITTDPTAGGHIDGNFDFIVRQGHQ